MTHQTQMLYLASEKMKRAHPPRFHEHLLGIRSCNRFFFSFFFLVCSTLPGDGNERHVGLTRRALVLKYPTRQPHYLGQRARCRCAHLNSERKLLTSASHCSVCLPKLWLADFGKQHWVLVLFCFHRPDFATWALNTMQPTNTLLNCNTSITHCTLERTPW